MNKALEYFEDMVFENQLDYGTENKKCNLIINQLRAIGCINNRAIFDMEKNQVVFVNKLIYIENALIIKGYLKDYKVDEYGKSWREVREDD